MGSLFQQGAKAVVLKGDPRIPWLWKSLIELQNGGHAIINGPIGPWETKIQDLALNHRQNDVYLGDMLRFTPGALAHIARKVLIFKDSNGQIKAIPDKFNNHEGNVVLKQKIYQTVWDISQDMLRSTLPENSDLKNYAVKIDMLHYPDSPEDLGRIFSLLADASGGWTRLGMKIDRIKAKATCFFDLKALRDLFALGSLIPGINILLRKINGFLFRFSKKKVPSDTLLVGEPHVDGPNILTALISNRDLLCTEVHGGKAGWVELPMSTDTLAIFPSEQLGKISTISPTTHRILFKETDDPGEINKPNITLNLSVIHRPPNL
ncbi:MAG: hypothetical protein ACR2MX_04635 [Cyclobacteriaceae bacterium]